MITMSMADTLLLLAEDYKELNFRRFLKLKFGILKLSIQHFIVKLLDNVWLEHQVGSKLHIVLWSTQLFTLISVKRKG